MAEDVFISYSHENKDAARILAEMIGAKGYGVWWDHELVAGDSYADVIESKLDAAKAVIVIWSETSRKSHWVRDEAAVGRDRNRLLPVAIDSNPPPLGFRQIQTIDLQGWDGRDAGRLASLFRGLSGLLGVQAQDKPAATNAFGGSTVAADEPAKGGKLAAGVNAAPNNKPLKQILHEEKKQRSFFRTYWLTSFIVSGVVSVFCGFLLASQGSSGMGGTLTGSASDQIGLGVFVAFVFVGIGLFLGRFFVIIGRRLSKRKSVRYFDSVTTILMIVSIVLVVPTMLVYQDPQGEAPLTLAEKIALIPLAGIGAMFPMLAFFSIFVGFLRGLGRTSYADGK
ncbi:MAG: toll/interleukin-1 receptor domain-containing protein [Alphaproteobacteria bacterium]